MVSVIEWEADRIAVAEGKLKSPAEKFKANDEEASTKDDEAPKEDSTDLASEKLTTLSIKD